MPNTTKIIVTLTLMLFAFFAGVKYSEAVKNHAGWLFEPKEEEVELPDLSNEAGDNSGEIGVPGSNGSENMNPGEPAIGEVPTNNAAPETTAKPATGVVQ